MSETYLEPGRCSAAQRYHLIRGAIFGHVIGDALGVPVEFVPREKLRSHPVSGMAGGGSRGYPAGTWSDDSSMTLCALASLTQCNGFDGADMMERFARWAQEGYMTSTGRAFGIGRTTAAAIGRFLRGEHSSAYGGKSEKDNGNGSLMRILPVVLFNFFCGADELDGQKLEIVYQASELTHAHPRSRTACGIYALIAAELLRKPEKPSILLGLKKSSEFYRKQGEYPNFTRLFSEGFASLPAEEIRSGGYVVDTLEAAVWCLLNSGTYEDCVLRAVNLGGDADTIAAIAGGLAGILYGEAGLPEAWVTQLADGKMIDGLCKKAAEAWGQRGTV